MNKLERYVLGKGQIGIRFISHDSLPERQKIAVVFTPGKEGANHGGAPLLLSDLRKGMRRLPPTTVGLTPLEKFGGQTLKGRYLQAMEIARHLDKNQTGGFDIFKFLYNRAEQMESFYVDDPCYLFLYFVEEPKESDFYHYRAAMRLHLSPEKKEALIAEMKNFPSLTEAQVDAQINEHP